MKRTIQFFLVVVLVACAADGYEHPCEGRWSEWYCENLECVPDPEGGVPEGAVLEWPLDRRERINQESDVWYYDPELHCLNPAPACCPDHWFECEGMERCPVLILEDREWSGR